MPEIRRLVVKFFTFVDVNGDHAVEIRELDDARAYLGLPPLSDKDHESLAALCNENKELEFEVIVNFVSIVCMLVSLHATLVLIILIGRIGHDLQTQSNREGVSRQTQQRLFAGRFHSLLRERERLFRERPMMVQLIRASYDLLCLCISSQM